MTYRVKQLVLDTQEEKVHGTFWTEGEAKMRLAQVLDEAFDGQDVEPAAVRRMIEDAPTKSRVSSATASSGAISRPRPPTSTSRAMSRTSLTRRRLRSNSSTKLRG